MPSQREVAEYLDLTWAAFKELLDRRIIPRDDAGKVDLDEARVAYIRHLREIAAGRKSSNPDAPDLTAERARLAKAQADAQEYKNEIQQGKHLPREQVVKGWVYILSAVRAKLLSAPSSLAPLLVGKDDPGEIHEIIGENLNEALAELSEDTGGGTGVVADEGDQGSAVVDAAPAETDDQSVGGSLPSPKRRGQRRTRKVENSSG